MHLCIAVKPADRPAGKPRHARARFSAAANGDGTVFEVTAAIDEGTDQERRMTCSFSIEDWTSEEPASKKRRRERKRKMAKELEGPEMAVSKRQNKPQCEAERRAVCRAAKWQNKAQCEAERRALRRTAKRQNKTQCEAERRTVRLDVVKRALEFSLQDQYQAQQVLRPYLYRRSYR